MTIILIAKIILLIANITVLAFGIREIILNRRQRKAIEKEISPGVYVQDVDELKDTKKIFEKE